MGIKIEATDHATIADLREGFRAEADCQIVHDSILPRRLADAYLLYLDDEVAAYGGVWTKYFPGRVVEFHTLEEFGDARGELFGRFLLTTGATEIEAQTNMPGMFRLLREFGGEPVEEKILFEAGRATTVDCPGARFRRRGPDDGGPEGEWVVELGGGVAAAGGVLTHYNPPYGDIYMEVEPSERRRGLGSFIVQELGKVCRESGLIPAARCNPGNIASRRTLERGGMVECGRLLAAPVKPEYSRGGPLGRTDLPRG